MIGTESKDADEEVSVISSKQKISEKTTIL